jgi:hypothetical protein
MEHVGIALLILSIIGVSLAALASQDEYTYSDWTINTMGEFVLAEDME